MERDEAIRWTGSSHPMAFMASHVPVVLIAGMLSIVGAAPAVQAVLGHDYGSLTLLSISLLAASLLGIFLVIRSIRRDMSVHWAVTDRSIYRISGDRIVISDVRAAVAIETRPRDGRTGDVLVTLPQTEDSDGRNRVPSVLLLGLYDMQGANAAISAVVAAAANRPNLTLVQGPM